MKIYNYSDGVSASFIENHRFKTRLATIRFMLPLLSETVTENCMAAELISACSINFPEPDILRRELKRLCGANITVSYLKSADSQIITFSASAIADEFGFEGEPPFKGCLDILYDLIFNPLLDGESFQERATERTRRIWKEELNSEINDKRIFAKNRMESIMFEGSPYEETRLGSMEKAERANGKDLYDAYLRLIRKARIRISVTAPEFPQDAIEKIANAFPKTQRYNPKRCEIIPEREPKEVIERLDVTQGKLVMGFSAKDLGTDSQTYQRAVFYDIFGGGTYSKLFSVVREKMSLCYYCSARGYRQKGFMAVESGVEEKNAVSARDAILAQLEAIRNGEFTPEQIEASKLSICNSLGSMGDKLSSLDIWYGMRMDEDNPLSPQEYAELIKGVTKEQIIECAKGTKLHTVYFLLGKGEE